MYIVFVIIFIFLTEEEEYFQQNIKETIFYLIHDVICVYSKFLFDIRSKPQYMMESKKKINK